MEAAAVGGRVGRGKAPLVRIFKSPAQEDKK